MKYVRNLSKVDDKVMSVSPQAGKQNRPLVGIIVVCRDKQYCIPFSSPKKKHESMKNSLDFMKMFNTGGQLIGVLNINNMIPVRDDVITRIDLKIHSRDNPRVRHYKSLLSNELAFCQRHRDEIVSKANNLYMLILNGKAPRSLRHRCCKFVELEKVLAQFNS